MEESDEPVKNCGDGIMTAQTNIVDPVIEQWHHNFERVAEAWKAWCEENAVRYDTASQAWRVFVEQQRLSRWRFDLDQPVSFRPQQRRL
jgi:hypothetical protein